VALLCGYQALLFGVLAKTVAVRERLLPPDPTLARWRRIASLEPLLIVGCLAMLAGLSALAALFWLWRGGGYGALDYARTLRLAIPAATATALGFTTVLAAFFSAIFDLADQ
jgi:hypothetical protein